MNILPLLRATDEELEKLNTRYLLAAYRRSRGSFYVCSCRYHCGDEVLNLEEQATNREVRAFHAKLKTLLDQRPHVPTSSESKARTERPHKERKRMEYRRNGWRRSK